VSVCRRTFAVGTGGDVIPASINANAVVHALANGSVILIGGGIHVAEHWCERAAKKPPLYCVLPVEQKFQAWDENHADFAKTSKH
jgi:hypothetical protein